MNMLSVARIREHGMSDERWTTKNKHSQYKGLVKLYRREMKILSDDQDTEIRATRAELKHFTKLVRSSKEELDDKLFGSKKKVEAVLMVNNCLRLKYRHLRPDVIIENLKQNVFEKRKKLDLVQCQKKKRISNLIDLKLMYGTLEEKFNNVETLETDIPCKRITGKIQDALLLGESAIVIRNKYMVILQLLAKDSTFYDHLLETLKIDILSQNKCLMDVIILGQLATEYLDDKKREYKELHNSVHSSYIVRKYNLRSAEERLQDLPDTLRNLIRSDSDVTIFPLFKSFEEEFYDLSRSINSAEHELMFIKSQIFVTTYQVILPVMKNQVVINEKLLELRTRYEDDQVRFTKYIDHANIRIDTIKHSNFEIVRDYLQQKKLLKKEIQKQKKRAKTCTEIKLRLAKSVAVIGITCRCIQDSLATYPIIPEKNRTSLKKSVEIETVSTYKVLDQIEKQLIKITQKYASMLDMDVESYSYGSTRRTLPPSAFDMSKTEKKVAEDDIYDEVFHDDPLVPTRMDIKEEGRKMVAYFKSLEF